MGSAELKVENILGQTWAHLELADYLMGYNISRHFPWITVLQQSRMVVRLAEADESSG